MTDQQKSDIYEAARQQRCAQCGWLKSDHQYGFCYSHSDEDSDHFYNDRKFISEASIEGKVVTRAFNGKLIIK